MASIPVEILLGLYLGLLVGLVPALVSWALGFLFRYFTGVTVPGFGVVVLAVAIAGASGGLLALADPSLTGSESQVRLTVALLFVLMTSLYAHSRGDQLGASVPRRLSLRKLTERTLSTDVIELVGGRGEVRVGVVGEVTDIEGYPPLGPDLRESIREETWTFPADLPLVELETRVADSLRTTYDLADVDVRIDERARATVAAAPPVGALSKRVPQGRRAVSLSTLVPTGVARGDEVTVVTDEVAVEGTVLSVRSDAAERSTAATDGGSDDAADAPAAPAAAATATGGEGRVTVAVAREDVSRLLAAAPVRFVVRSRGTRREFELVSLLRRAGGRFERLSVREDGPLDGVTLAEATVRDRYGVAILAVRDDGRWVVAPRGAQSVRAGDDLYAVGTREALRAFREAVA
jgi:hypothetical protein